MQSGVSENLSKKKVMVFCPYQKKVKKFSENETYE